jgi:lipoyl(octanoyl) transferase
MVETPVAVGADDLTLQVYLLGQVDYDEMLQCQRRLVFEVSGDRSRGVLLLCEHPPLISVGREGSREHIRYEPAELDALEWPVRWVNRGGGCLLHLPGQLAIYSILALDRLKLDLQGYLDRLHAAILDALTSLSVPACQRPDRTGLWVKDRLIAQIGVAVRDWVSYFGAAINIHPDLEPYRRVLPAGRGEPAMTSLARELREPVREAAVRQRLVEAVERHFGFRRTSLFHHHPALTRPAPTDAIASRLG